MKPMFGTCMVVLVWLAAAGSQPVASLAPNSWSSGAPMPTARQGVATGFIKGKVYVVSGATNSTVTAVNEIYTVSTNTWKTGAPIPTPRFVPASAVVNGILYVMDGNSGSGVLNVVEAYDPVHNTWSAKAPMPTARDSCTAVVLKGLIYVVVDFLRAAEDLRPSNATIRQPIPGPERLRSRSGNLSQPWGCWDPPS